MRRLSNKEVQSIQLNILKGIVEFCNENNLRFYLIYGSLLGAVRHNGFIPWDDDIDIAMSRPDYEKFLHTFNVSHKQYKVESFRINKYVPYFYAKVQDINTLVVPRSNHGHQIGVSVDVFPIDGASSNSIIQWIHFRLFEVIRLLYNFKTKVFKKEKSLGRNLLLSLGKLFAFWIPFGLLVRVLDSINRLYSFEKSEYVTVCASTDKRISYDKKEFEKVVFIEFEGIPMPCPVGYDLLLKSMYKDYMKLPEPNKRVSHHQIEAFELESNA